MSPWAQRVEGSSLKVLCLDITLTMGRLVMADTDCQLDNVWNNLGDRSVSVVKDFYIRLIEVGRPILPYTE